MKQTKKNSKLIKKSKAELQLLAKSLGAKRIYKSTKKELIKFILKNNTKKKLGKSIIQKPHKNFFKSWFFIIITSIILPVGIYFLSPSNDDVKGIIDKRFQQYEEKELKLGEYIEQIINLRKINKKFLERIFQDGHKVYGTRNGKFIEVESYKSRNVINNFSSKLTINKET